MIINQIYSAYYSATYTTRKIIQTLTAELTDNATELDITEQKQSHTFGPDDLLIVGAPVYSGQIGRAHV